MGNLIKKCYVYEITNSLNMKSYIGSRVCDDPKNDIEYMGSGAVLNEAYITLGIENFNKKIIKIYENVSKKYLLDEESRYIIFFNTLNPNGYNLKLPNDHANWHRYGIPLSKYVRKKYRKV